jgi:hypothetical protein
VSTSEKKPLARSLGAFVGHIARALRSDPGRSSKSVTVSKTVEEEDRGDVVLRRTTIDEVEYRKGRTDEAPDGAPPEDR